MWEVLVECYRGTLLENVHPGNIAVVDENLRTVYSAGDSTAMTYYRSCSKPIQALPLLLHGLDKKYGLTQKELAVCCSSHYGEPFHVETILGILAKAGFTEEDFIMLPDYPHYREEHIRQNLPKRKVYHNCSGKHSSLLMVSKEVDGDYHDYYKLESRTQQEILDCIAHVAQWPKEKILTGTDGCGVPVFAVPLNHMAYSYLKLRCPDVEQDPAIAAGLATFCAAMNAHPELIRGTGSMCKVINADPNLVGKIGAEGVYTLGMKKERLGIAIKMMDGNVDPLPMVVKNVLQQLGYQNEPLFKGLDEVYDKNIYNHNHTVIGERKPTFTLKKSI